MSQNRCIFAGDMKRMPILLLVLLLCACYTPPHTRYASMENLPEGVRDSLTFAYSHHYSVGYNFVVHADSLLLLEERPLHTAEGAVAASDTAWVREHDQIVVAAITMIPEDSTDSVWVKVARDQLTMGWTHEKDLLAQASPDDPISQFIRIFSSRHTIWFLAVIGLALLVFLIHATRHMHYRCLLHNDIPSAYPTLLTACLAAATVVYAHIQRHDPQLWVHFYFHPTLNPLAQPPLLCIFLSLVWLLLLLMVTALQNIFQLQPLRSAVLYLLFLLGISMALYIVFSLIPSSAVALLLCLAYGALTIGHYWVHARAQYFCGKCGLKLQHKGTCPRCGAVNE